MDRPSDATPHKTVTAPESVDSAAARAADIASAEKPPSSALRKPSSPSSGTQTIAARDADWDVDRATARTDDDRALTGSRRGSTRTAVANALLAAAARRPAAYDYAIALAVTAITIALDWLLNQLPMQTQFQCGLLGVVITAWLCSLGAALLGVLVAAMVETILFLDPGESLTRLSPDDSIQLALFAAVSMLICVLADRVKRTRRDRAIALRQLLVSDRAREASERRLDAGLNVVSDPLMLLMPVFDETDPQRVVDFTIEYANAAAARFAEPGQLDPTSPTGDAPVDNADASPDGIDVPPDDTAEEVAAPDAADTTVARVLTGQRLSIAAPAHVKLGLMDAYADVLRSGRPLDRAVVFGPPGSDQRAIDRRIEVEVRAASLGDGLIVHWRDVSEHRKVQEAIRANEERYRSLVQAIGAVVWRTDASGEFNARQLEWAVFTGQRAEEVSGLGWLNAVHPDDRAETMLAWRQALNRQRDCTLEHRLRRADGEYRHMQARAVPIRNAAGEIVEWVGIHSDVTERRRASQILADSERQLRRVLNALYAFVGVLTPDGTLLGVNEAPLRAADLRTDDVVGRKVWDTYWWSHDAKLRTDLKDWVNRARKGEVIRRDVRTRVSGGRMITIDFMLAPMRDEHGDITHLIPSGVDVSDRVSAQHLLADRERHYRQLTEGLPMLTWTCDSSGACDYVSQRWVDYSGRPMADLLGYGWAASVHPDDSEHVRARWHKATHTGERYACEYRIRRHDGEFRWFDTRAEPIRDAAGNVVRWFGTNIDIHDRRQAEQRFRRLYESNLAGVVFYDIGGSLTDPNDAFLVLLGYDPASPPPPGTLDWNRLVEHAEGPGADVARERWRQLAQTGRCEPFEASLRRADGRAVPVMVAAAELEPGHHANGVAYVIDLTHVKAVEEALRRTEANLRMVNESLEHRIQERTLELQHRSDQLRALALDLTETESRERKRLAQVLHDHFQQLVSAAKLKVGIIRRRLTDPALLETVKQVENLLEETINASRSLATELSPPVLHDAGLGPALDWLARRMEKEHNLVVAVQFDQNCEPDNEQVRTIVFECARELLFNVHKHAQTDKAELVVNSPQDGLLQVSVIDHGKGFDSGGTELKAKPDGSFGLFSITERLGLLGGLLKVKSEPEKGTIVSMTVPVTFRSNGEDGQASGRELRELGGGPNDSIVGATVVPHIRVLVADDHRLFREGLISLLQQEPYVEIVGQANDGQEAVVLTRQLKPDILIVDVTMPKLNGVQVTTQLTKERPEVKIIGLSMHERDDMAKAMRDAGAIAYCTKGGPTETLLNVLRSVATRAK